MHKHFYRIAGEPEILTNLAKDFVFGYANSEPLSSQICKQCEFGILCRYDHNNIDSIDSSAQGSTKNEQLIEAFIKV